VAANFGVIGSATPVIAQLEGTGKLRAAVEEEFIRSRTLTFDNYDIFVHFRPAVRASGLAPTVVGPPEPQAAYWWDNWGRTNFSLWDSTPICNSGQRGVRTSPEHNS